MAGSLSIPISRYRLTPVDIRQRWTPPLLPPVQSRNATSALPVVGKERCMPHVAIQAHLGLYLPQSMVTRLAIALVPLIMIALAK